MPEQTSSEPANAAPTGSTPSASGTSGASPSSTPPAAAPKTSPASSPSPSPTTDQPSGEPAKPAEKPGDAPAPKTGEAPPKDGEEPKPADAAPPPSPTAAYDALEIPPQVDPASPALGEFKELAARHKVAPEVAQELVQFYAAQLQATVDAQNAARAAQDAAWAKEVKQDPDIGHLQWPHTSRAIAKLREAMPTVNAALDVLDKQGLGNQPAVIRAFRDLGFAFVEDRLVVAGSSAGKANPYPNTPGMRD